MSTGSAVAIGNDAHTEIVQATGADATNLSSDTSSQVAISLRIGVAIADSGSNSIIARGSVGAGAAVVSGGATAVGNESLTDVEQRAVAAGSGSSRLTIEQQALVINLGIALANSGVNEVRGLAGSLLATPDEQISEQLFALLLPALLASAAPAAADGGGTIGTGDALAIGNRSTTEVDQTAVAVAAGDGSAAVRQQVVVANVGAAVANTGANQLGAAGAPVPLDEQSMEIVSALGRFLTELLTELNGWTGATPLNGRSLTLPFGDLVVDVNSALGGNQVAIGDAGATMRGPA